VEIGEFTKLYTYTYPEGQSNETVVRSNSKDLRYDLDEMTYYGGLPVSQRAATNQVLLSSTNFRGCLNVVTFNKKKLDLSKKALQLKSSDLTFHGKYIDDCKLNEPTFLKSFETVTDNLEVYSHANKNMFKTEFYYRTYQQAGNILLSTSSAKASSLSLSITDNTIQLIVNVTKTESIAINHHDKNANDGVWRKIRVEITPLNMLFAVEKSETKYNFNKTKKIDFPYKTVFGGQHGDTPGIIGCIKDVYLGNDLQSINTIMNLTPDIKYQEKLCTMKDHCLPDRPCFNGGRCVQQPTGAVCKCEGTGYSGQFCQKENKQKYQSSCTKYFKLGYRVNGIFTIKPGNSPPFTVFCDMKNKKGPRTIIKTNSDEDRFVFKSKSYDKNYYYHQVTYQANKQQIADLITVSQTCRQYVRYDCISSSLLNSFKTERSSNFGIRWYSRKGFQRRYWHGDMRTANKQSCKCGLEGNCVSNEVLCNCDMRDQIFRYDDGYISQKEDLPVSKLRISIQRTNHRSSFHIGNLECGDSDTFNISNSLPSVTPDIVTDNNIFLLESTTPSSNQTDIKESKTKSKNFVLIDTKLLYGIIIAVILLISLLVLILVLKRRLCCCCYYENKAKPQIVEIYKDAELGSQRNNNKSSFRLSNDVAFNANDVMVSLKRGMSTSYHVSNSDSSVSTIDPNHYYQHDSDTLDIHHSIIPPEPPKRSILKIKKDLHHTTKRQSDGSNHLTSGSENSITKNVDKSSPPNHNESFLTNNYGIKRDFVNEGDTKNGISPLKQKILEMSTSRQRLHSGELYFNHQDSFSTMKSLSSCSSSKDSDINTEDDESLNDLSELLPFNKNQHSKNVRFNNTKRQAFYTQLYRTSAESNQKQEKIPGHETTNKDYLLHSDADKTLV